MGLRPRHEIHVDPSDEARTEFDVTGATSVVVWRGFASFQVSDDRCGRSASSTFGEHACFRDIGRGHIPDCVNTRIASLEVGWRDGDPPVFGHSALRHNIRDTVLWDA